MVGKLVDVLDGADLSVVESPCAVNVCGQDSVVGWGQGGVVTLVVADKTRAGGLENGEVLQGRGEGEIAVSLVGQVGDLDVLAVLLERVVVQSAVDLVLGPLVLDDVDVDARDVRVLVHKVFSQVGGKTLDGPHVCLSGLDQNGVLDCVGRHDRRVVCLRVGHIEVTREQDSDGCLEHFLLLWVVLVLLDLKELNVVLAVGGVL